VNLYGPKKCQVNEIISRKFAEFGENFSKKPLICNVDGGDRMVKKLLLGLAIIACLAGSAVAKGEFQGRVFTETPIMTINEAWMPESLKISPNGINIGMIVKDASGKTVVVNGVRQKKYDDILDDALYFTPDSQHILYIAKKNNNFVLVYDGVEHAPYAEIKKKSLVLSPDGSGFAYVAKAGKQWRVVQDKTEHPVFDDINVMTLKFSPDGKRLVYAAQQNGAWLMVDNGQAGEAYDGIRNLVFSPDGKRLAALVRDGSEFRVVVNGEQTSGYEFIRSNSLCFSPDGQRLGFVAQAGDEEYAVVNGKAAKRYRKIGNQGIVFSQTGHHYGYTALTEKGWVVVVDGLENGPYDAVLEHSPVFSPNGERVAYAAKVGAHWTVSVDGKQAGVYDAIGEGTLVFSPDSRNFAYAAQKNGKWTVSVNHRTGRFYDGIGRESLGFNKRGDLAYSACRANHWYVVFNGSEGRAYDQIITGYGGRILGESGFGYQAIDGSTIYYIAEKIWDRMESPRDMVRSRINPIALQKGQVYRFKFNPPVGKRLREVTRQTLTFKVGNQTRRTLEREVFWESLITKSSNEYLITQKFVSVRLNAVGRQIDQKQLNNELKNAEIRYYVDPAGRLRDVQVQGNVGALLADENQGVQPTAAQVESMLRKTWDGSLTPLVGKAFKIGDSWDYLRESFPLPNGKVVTLQIRVTATDEVKVGNVRCIRLDYDFDFDNDELQRYLNEELFKGEELGARSKVKSIRISGYDLVDPDTLINHGMKVEYTMRLTLDLPGAGVQEAVGIIEIEQQVDVLD